MQQIEDLFVETPVIESAALSKGQQVLLKMECYQPTSSFKIRGIGRAAIDAKRQGKTALVASSGGNAGYSVAYAGHRLGMSTTVFLPVGTPSLVRRLIEMLGAKTEEHGKNLSETHARAQAVAAQQGAEFIHPFDDQRIVDGHSTLVDELVRADREA